MSRVKSNNAGEATDFSNIIKKDTLKHKLGSETYTLGFFLVPQTSKDLTWTIRYRYLINKCNILGQNYVQYTVRTSTEEPTIDLILSLCNDMLLEADKKRGTK